MEDVMNKSKLLQQLMDTLEEKASITNKSFERAQKDVIEAPGRMESRYDSTKQESSYLADSFYKRSFEIDQAIKTLKSLSESRLQYRNVIEIGSVVRLKESGQTEDEWYIILPVGGGETLYDNSTEIFVISSYSPIADCLLEKRKGDSIKLSLDRNSRQLEILEVL
jgi:transcription elongation GreA/GreB family factor